MRGSRRSFLKATGVAMTAAAQERSSKPNIVLWMPETTRAESIGCYGHPVVKTPNLDRLAAEGARFEQCHVQNPVCSPSRCSFLTGWPVHVRGHRSLYYLLRPNEPQLFRYLKQNGYDVYWYGKNDALAPDSFRDSVTEYRDFPAGKNQPRNPFGQDDPRYYSFLQGPWGDRRETDDYAKVQAGIRASNAPKSRSAFFSRSASPILLSRLQKISTACTIPRSCLLCSLRIFRASPSSIEPFERPAV